MPNWVMDALARLRSLYDREREKNRISSPEILGSISAVEILYLFQEHEKSEDTAPYKFFDGKYNLTLLEEVMRFVKWARLNELKYIDELQDCDDYAFGLVGKFCSQTIWNSLPVGVVVAGNHVLCCVVAIKDSKPQLFFIEPQTSECVSVTDKIWMVLIP